MNVIELYSGIGGMHFALKECGIDYNVVKAVDINTTANEVYKLNFPKTLLLGKNIQSLLLEDFNGIDMILMSPPCQPHTRNGLKRDNLDERSHSLLYLLTLLPKLNSVNYILLENVKGFEISRIRNELVDILINSGYTYQEFLLTPTQFGIPNSRLRYYLLAKKKPLEFSFSTKSEVLDKLPVFKNDVESKIFNLQTNYKNLVTNSLQCYPLKQILNDNEKDMVPEKVLKKYGTIFDVVTSESYKSCCFTKGYGHFVEGTGSVLSSKSSSYVEEVYNNLKKIDKNSSEALNLLKSLNLRYFTPKEISKLMCFPDSLTFPNYFTKKQKYRLLGNSVNVHVVGLLIRILVA